MKDDVWQSIIKELAKGLEPVLTSGTNPRIINFVIKDNEVLIYIR